MPVNIVTANIKSVPPMRQSYVNSDVWKVKNLGETILWQEISPTRYKDAVQSILPAPLWQNKNIEIESPISLDSKEWEVLQSGTKETHSGRAAVTPHRYVSWVIARRRSASNSNKVVVFMNSHFISGAWSNRQPLTKKWRQGRWNHHYDVMDKMVERFVKAGYTVIGGGDWNKSSVEKFVPNQRWLAIGGIDHLFVVEAPHGVRVTLNHIDKVPGLHTDHEPRVANISLTRPRGYVVPDTIPTFTDLLYLDRSGKLVAR